jgi:hypothetical protein
MASPLTLPLIRVQVRIRINMYFLSLMGKQIVLLTITQHLTPMTSTNFAHEAGFSQTTREASLS